MDELLRAVTERLAGQVDRRALAAAAAALSDAYRGTPDRPRGAGAMAGDAARIAYVATRLPATLAALRRVVDECALRMRFDSCRDLLELGAGPGPAAWALGDYLPALARVTLVDEDHRMLACARELFEAKWPPGTVRLDLVASSLSSASPPAADIVVMSYALGEVDAAGREALVRRAWDAARHALIVVEPGTSPGFERIRRVRDAGLAAGAHVVAPCPHAAPCPVESPDWCHFATRLERSRLHRQLKGGTLGFEDEKFAYVAFARTTVAQAPARVVARPLERPGHVVLRLCTPAGLETRTVSRRDGSAYRAARHARWGDPWS